MTKSEYAQLKLEEMANGVILPVRAKPAARQNSITGVFNGALKVSVTTAPEKGKANKAILKLLSKELGIPAKLISLHSGETSGEKKFFICAHTLEDVQSIILSRLS